MESVAMFMIVLIMKLISQIKPCVILNTGIGIWHIKHDHVNNMHKHGTNNYRFVCMHTKNIIGLIV